MKPFFCFGLNAIDRGIQPWLAIFPIHISIDYPELALLEALTLTSFANVFVSPRPYLLTPGANG